MIAITSVPQQPKRISENPVSRLKSSTDAAGSVAQSSRDVSDELASLNNCAIF